uniref:Uncharacterized protein n=1 Tax=Arundo donax TaxID=35708 RepID=A0A0A9CC92_ARUDO
MAMLHSKTSPTPITQGVPVMQCTPSQQSHLFQIMLPHATTRMTRISSNKTS